jgi:hypothetical protein
MSECVHIQVERHYYLRCRGIDEVIPAPRCFEVYRAYCLLRVASDRSQYRDVQLANHVHEMVDVVIVPEFGQAQQVVMSQ